LPPHHALGAPLLIERRAVGVARLGEDAHAEADDSAGLARRVVIDEGEADGRRADVEAENAHG